MLTRAAVDYDGRMGRHAYTDEQRRAAFRALTSPGPGGCLLWTGGTGGHREPRGVFWNGTRQVVAARWSLEHLGGEPPPPGMECEHLCNVALCVEPTHLEWVTHLENERRKTQRGRRPTGPTGKVCEHHGVVLDGVAKRRDGRVFAFCTACRRDYQRGYKRARRAAARE